MKTYTAIKQYLQANGGYHEEKLGNGYVEVYRLLPDGRMEYLVVDRNDMVVYERVF